MIFCRSSRITGKTKKPQKSHNLLIRMRAKAGGSLFVPCIRACVGFFRLPLKLSGSRI